MQEDYKEVVSYLQQVKNIVDVDTCFYHNREWCKKRVRVSVSKAAEHAQDICFIHALARTTPVMKKYYNGKVENIS